MDAYTIKTVLVDGEKILVCQLGTIMSGARVSGHIILTNKRLLWEKSTGITAMGMGVLGAVATGNKELSIPIEEIERIEDYWIPMAAGIQVILKSGQMYKFQLNGKTPKQVREQIKSLCANK